MQNFRLKCKIFTLSIVVLTFTFLFLNLSEASAHCPLCVAGAGAGLSLASALGIDDSITGVWISALLGATALFSAGMIKKKILPFQTLIIYLGTFAGTLWSFYQFNLVNLHSGTILGLPKLTFGIASGALLFLMAGHLNLVLIKTSGRVFVPYQGIIVVLGSIIVWSIIVYILINYYI